MRYLTFSDQERTHYPICLLVPSIRKEDIQKEYLVPFAVDPESVLVLDLHYSRTKKKTPQAEMKEYLLSELIPVFEDYATEYLVVTDGEYFKMLTKTTKIDPHLGYVLDCAYGPWKVVYVPNHKAIFYDPEKVRAKIAQGMQALVSHRAGTYQEPGNSIIHFAEYPETYAEIEAWLERLLVMDVPLTIDIEGFDLKHHKCGIGTITFCWSKHEGIAFAVDYQPIPGATEAPFGRQVRNEPIRRLLKSFFQRLKQKAIYHNISFDAYVLIYQLFMNGLLDTQGLLEGMEVLLSNWDCTKLITYLATNSCAGNKLSLKDQAQEFAGNYAQTEIHDITKIPVSDLLPYNLVDGLSTWFVHEKHWDTLVQDQQEEIYTTLFKPAVLDIVQMQLTGLPVNMPRVKEVRLLLEADEKAAVDTIHFSPLVQRFTHQLNENWVAWKNATLKKKRVTLADAKEVFNPNSDPQLQELLYGMLALPVIDLTDSKQPATGKDTLKALRNHTSDPDIHALLDALMDFKAVNKILTSFIPAMEAAALAEDGWHYLFGNINLGGTVSGRLSSSNPNLQNLPATGSKYAALIKSCFQASPGWIFVGLDFNSLEDRISALTTKDPNKLVVYTQGFDGHSLRAHAYFGDRMPDIQRTPNEAVCYKANVGGTDVYFHADEDVEYMGKVMKGSELYDLLTG